MIEDLACLRDHRGVPFVCNTSEHNSFRGGEEYILGELGEKASGMSGTELILTTELHDSPE